jgi:triosephosphate isomerase
MPVPIVVGNWKMNTSVSEALKLALDMKEALEPVQRVEKVICPPFISLEPVSRAIQGSSVKLGAQNMHYQEKGAFTGEVSPPMLADMCQYVILGHSERRQHFGESDTLINLKVKAACEAGLRPILCVGETLEQREEGRAADVVAGQVKAGLDSLHNISGVVMAYEPIWAIGTGVAATPGTASEVMGGVILRTLAEIYGEQVAAQVPLLYGGSVNADNVEGFVNEKSIHGALVGGASLRADQFAEIAWKTARSKDSG